MNYKESINSKVRGKMIEYFKVTIDMDLDRCLELLKFLDNLEKNNGWLPSPHTIEPYIDYIQNLAARTEWTEELLELEDRLCDHFTGAYEQ